MSKSVRGSFKWLAGWGMGMALLGGCAGLEESTPPASGEAQAVEGPEAAAGEVAVRLSLGKATLGAAESLQVTVTLTNLQAYPVRLLKWYTPADGLEEPLFVVTRQGAPVEFLGPHYKRPAPGAADYLTLAPGESLTRTVELSGLYDLSETGSYAIRYEVAPGAGTQGVRQLASNELSVWLEGRPNRALEEREVSATVTSDITFTGNCTTTQQSTLLQAVGAASAMADNSALYLGGTPSATPRYTTWFGAFSTSGWNTAKSQFAAIKDGFDTRPLTLDCKCKKSYYAYVYPSQPYKIYLCNAFWNAPMTGTDSKGGTLVHEMSHFTVVAGTDDWAYGHTAAKNLAISDPAKALNNADSHEYFAENTPVLQ